jgi:hypothetical protein
LLKQSRSSSPKSTCQALLAHPNYDILERPPFLRCIHVPKKSPLAGISLHRGSSASTPSSADLALSHRRRPCMQPPSD